MMWLDQRHFLS